eukprot:CAMPEP_0201282474 /NCGR_PEP_ID=MMETSP1317-20130820/5720_1 /ASSEMBLY_ACC=CAM_ASM_000770 /TAXON_ID=187299 /ORGANISM="Undescribed Undescribed, Strain Undescribed" /LENGTH=237 /DNA_ID=CAMNT_0047595219 /DNA_START=52 /DNA_END=765 /DNA_ORIENTATION=+
MFDVPADHITSQEKHDYDGLVFVRKVLGVLSIQFGLTATLCSLVNNIPELADFMYDLIYVFFGMLAYTVLVGAIVCCCIDCAVKPPFNWIITITFTIAEMWVFGTLCTLWEAKIVVAALSIATLICIALLIYALCADESYSTWVAFFILLACCIGVGTLYLTAWGTDHITKILIAEIILVVYGVYIICDLRLMMKGRLHGLKYDEYLIGALVVYMDIMAVLYIVAAYCISKVSSALT